jgi:hypothetical protein
VKNQLKKEKPLQVAPKRKKDRRRKDKVPLPKGPTKLEIQLSRELNENLGDIPTTCDWGTKRDSKGNSYSWIVYKLHIDTIDSDIPVSAILSSVSMHDSQTAIPLAQMSTRLLTNY